MQKYLIDANLPYYFSLWHHKNYQHVIDIDPKMKEFHDSISTIWNDVLLMSKDFKLVRVYNDTIEGVG